MDKRAVIAAYRRGFITIHECAQIIGVDKSQMTKLVNESQLALDSQVIREIRSVNNL